MTEDEKYKYQAAIRWGFINPNHPDWTSFCGSWVRKYPSRNNVLRLFRKILGENPTWGDLTDDVIREWVLRLTEQVSQNSVRSLSARLRSVLNTGVLEGKPIPAKNFARILNIKKVPSQAIYLTEHEVAKFDAYQPRTAREEYEKECFMREMLTGARIGDARRLTESNIHERITYDQNKRPHVTKWIDYVAEKTSTEVSVPMDKRLDKYLKTTWPEKFYRMRSDSLINGIRRIAKNCCINDEVTLFYHGKNITGPKWRFIATHTGRRTFATLLSQRGCPVQEIALMMGHMDGNMPNISMTATYILDKPKVQGSTFEYFK